MGTEDPDRVRSPQLTTGGENDRRRCSIGLLGGSFRRRGAPAMKTTGDKSRRPRRFVGVRWDRKLWGVVLSDSTDGSLLLGEVWHGIETATRPGEPTRALLFTSRKAARAWCRAKAERYSRRNDCCADWVFTFTPVRVRELIDVSP